MLWRVLLMSGGGTLVWVSLRVLGGLGDTVEPTKALLARTAVVIVGASLVLLGLLLPRLDAWLRRVLEPRTGEGVGYPTRASLGPRDIAFSLGVTVAAGAIVLTWLAAAAPDTVTRLVAEDGPLEYLTAIAYLAAAAITFGVAVRSRARRLLASNLGLLAALDFFVAMEEISWGQRLIGFEVPALLLEANVQDEFNLHNVWSTSIAQFAGLAVSGVILGLMPLLRATTWWFRATVQVLQLPVAPLSVSALYGAALVAFISVGHSLGTLGVGPFSTSGRAPHLDDEVLEVLLAGLFLMASAAAWSIDLTRVRAEEEPGQGSVAEVSGVPLRAHRATRAHDRPAAAARSPDAGPFEEAA